jgi:hypothetical protein
MPLLINGTGDRLWIRPAFAQKLTEIDGHEVIALEGAPHDW